MNNNIAEFVNPKARNTIQFRSVSDCANEGSWNLKLAPFDHQWPWQSCAAFRFRIPDCRFKGFAQSWFIVRVACCLKENLFKSEYVTSKVSKQDSLTCTEVESWMKFSCGSFRYQTGYPIFGYSNRQPSAIEIKGHFIPETSKHISQWDTKIHAGKADVRTPFCFSLRAPTVLSIYGHLLAHPSGQHASFLLFISSRSHLHC